MKPLPENPEGFWERYDIYFLQERMLATMKLDWSTVSPLRGDWHKTDEMRQLKVELVELVKREFSERPLWLWKDPRSCLLMPLWREVLAELDIDLKVVFVVRNPLDVARSLEQRNRFTLDKGLGVWFNFTLSALKDLKGLETIFVSYDRFLDDWETELKNCSGRLGIEWPVDEAGLRLNIANFLRTDLRHSASCLDELNALKAPEPVIRLYVILLEILSGTRAFDVTSSELELMYSEFLSYARFFKFDMVGLADCRALLEAEAALPEKFPAFAELKSELDTRTRWAWKLDSEVKVLREQLASMKKAIKDNSTTSNHDKSEVIDSIRSLNSKMCRFIQAIQMKIRK